MMKFHVLRYDPSPLDSIYSTRFRFISPVEGEAPKCEECGQFTGPITILPPFKVEVEILGHGFPDIAFGPGDNLLVSNQFKEKYTANSFNGLTCFTPVEVLKVRGIAKKKLKEKGFPPYFQTKVSLGARLDIEKSGLEDRPGCSKCLIGHVKRIRSVEIESETWNGNELFVPCGLSGTILVAESFKAFCERENIRNAVFVPATEYAFDFHPWEKGLKGVRW